MKTEAKTQNLDFKLRHYLKFMPPNVLANICVEANEARGDGTSDSDEEYQIQIEAAFAIEEGNNGQAELLQQIIQQVTAQTKARTEVLTPD